MDTTILVEILAGVIVVVIGLYLEHKTGLFTGKQNARENSRPTRTQIGIGNNISQNISESSPERRGCRFF